ncbi:MAG: twin-arginine translocase subunit TatC [Pirellulales bacterium]|nr:twin-arginine translocase subunit TatC [Pirellulales bacterium]
MKPPAPILSSRAPRPMRQRPSDEDLFAGSTMTFGEHLEELRGCLFKSVLALVAGCVLGLFIGGSVVDFIQSPLENALTSYYENQATEDTRKALAAMEASGEPLPASPERIASMVAEEHLLPTEALVDPRMVLSELQRVYPERFGEIELPPAGSPPAAGPVAPDGADAAANGVASNGGSTGQADEDVEPLYTRQGLIRIFLWHPTEEDSRIRAKGLSVHEAFSIYVKASLLVGTLLASPYIFYQIWSFVAAGLYPHEKKYVHVFLPFSLGLFLLGAATAFFFVFEPVLAFLFSFNRGLGIDLDPRISEWLGFVLVLPIGFGISFQLPLVMLFLERIGIFSVEAYRSKLRIAILVIFIISMFLTPADPYSMLLMAVPLTFLYFGGILLCKLMPRRRGPHAAA